MIDPTEAHEAGDVITIQGQTYYLMGIERRVAVTGGPGRHFEHWEIWQSTCCCGRPLLVETPRYRKLRKLRKPLRRCPKCPQ